MHDPATSPHLHRTGTDGSPRRVFLATVAGAVLCVPAAWLIGRDTAWLLQLALVVATFGAAAVYRQATRVHGDRPGERAPLVLGPPRRPGLDGTARSRLAAAWAIAGAAAYLLAMIGLLVAPTVRAML